jgi:hypothetical protein
MSIKYVKYCATEFKSSSLIGRHACYCKYDVSNNSDSMSVTLA